MKKYTALIVDIKKSRSYNSRARNEMQRYIMETVHELNSIFSNSLEKGVEFSAGDELQGLFSSVEAAYLYFRLFSMLISPIQIRAGIGIGEWNVIIQHAGTTAQDGSAYHNARFAIEATEETLGYSVLLFSGGKDDIIVNSLLNATAVLIDKQSQYQNEIMLLVELLYPITAHGEIVISELKRIVKLSYQRSYDLEYEFFRKRTKEPVFYKVDCSAIESKAIEVDNEDSFFVVDGKVRGLPIQLAELLGVSRQTIDRTIKSGNIYEIRNLSIAVVKCLKNMEEFTCC